MLSEKTEKALSHNSLQGGMLGTETEALSANVTTDKAIRPGVPETAGNVFNERLKYLQPQPFFEKTLRKSSVLWRAHLALTSAVDLDTKTLDSFDACCA